MGCAVVAIGLGREVRAPEPPAGREAEREAKEEEEKEQAETEEAETAAAPTTAPASAAE